VKLRKWQQECVREALLKYSQNKRHFLCLATPGAGKTTMAAEVAARLFDQDLIDFVLCFSPGKAIKNDIRSTLEERILERFDGVIGAKGASYTYQSMPSLNDKIWRLLKTHRVLVIFDEIHHCCGISPEDANAWGEKIITHIQHQATYTLALTGTPWRSDKTPIVLAEYQGDDNKILCDYVYGLADAIRDKVCRIPEIVVTDNNDISLQKECGAFESFKSFAELLEETACPYQRIVENENVIRHIINQANNKLLEIRKRNPSAGGLVVASSVLHAEKILHILRYELNVSAEIATYQEHEPTSIIENFKQSATPWIVSVGMISEGTNIPRLQVCCHLTRIKTELHFRQILGRILRITNATNQEACLFMPAEQTLIEYACRVAEDIPEENAVVRFETSDTGIYIDESEDNPSDAPRNRIEHAFEIAMGEEAISDSTDLPAIQNQKSLLTQTYEATLNVFGQFHQDILALNVSPFD
jgi:superfamily II DNA or RNA helicase